MKILFNRHITEIRVREKAQHWSSLTYGIGKRQVGTIFGIFPRYETVEGLFGGLYDDKYWGTIEEYNTPDRNTYFENGEFYCKPHCVICMSNGTQHTVYFKTVAELTAYADELKSIAPHITLK
jgi:hypothetical protein